ncbi:MAG TPA: radical SAM protein [Longimicrobium sp.]|nr:radical SAM protein [Longimicrobium sp.]
MRRLSVRRTARPAGTLAHMWRRQAWITDHLTPRKAANLLLAGTQWALRHEVMRAGPVVAKVDISPLCNLRCTVCVHSTPSEGSSPLLAQQRFRGEQRMSVDRYREVVGQLSGRTAAVSLYYLGDPLMHPHLEEICDATREAGLNAHVSSNFSFDLPDERLRALLDSGLTHLSVCVDGLTQETYGRTRVGGRIDRVLDNLDRLLRLRRESGRAGPRVEVQYIKFQHNLHELEVARARFTEAGVDQFTDFWGSLYNYTDFDDGRVRVAGPRPAGWAPRCMWPHFALLVRYDGDVIPCCTHRIGMQYTEDADRRAVGNVFDQGVWEVWNSPAYRALRRLTANPRRAAREPALAATFCEGCSRVYETDHDRHVVRADRHPWEDFYAHGPRGRVVRKPLVQLDGPLGRGRDAT